MAYLGNIPARSFISFERQVFTIVNSQTAYTLSHSVTNENDIRLVVNNVVQEPGSGKAYTASGTTLTLSAALTNGTDEMYCVFLGRAVGTVNAPAGSVSTSQLVDLNVTTAKIAADAVTSAKANFFNADTLAADLGTGLHVKTADSGASANTSSDELVVEGSGTSGISILSGNGSSGVLDFGDDGDNNIGRLIYSHADNSLQTVVNASERMRIDSSGNLLVGKSVTDAGTTGCNIEAIGTGVFTRSGAFLLLVNRLTDDGSLITLRQNNTEEGTISVSGSTVSYNSFTGSHWSRFSNNSKPTILKGTVLETLDEMCDWYNLEFNDNNGASQKIPHVLTAIQSDGDKITYNHNGIDYEATIVKEADIKHMKSKVSDTVDAKNVYGVFSNYDLDGEGYNDFYVASVGSFVVRIKSGQTIAKGDLLQSNGDGTAKVQSDDNIKSSSFAKILSTTVIETYDDGSFIVPCSLMC